MPPQVRPTANASSSEYPNVHSRGVPVARTSSASVTTAPSTQPPDTEPATSPSSLTAMVAPGPRGPDPMTSTTVARATLRPSAPPPLDVVQDVLHGELPHYASVLPAPPNSVTSATPRCALQESVHIGAAPPPSPGQGRVTGGRLQRVDPDDLVGHPVQAGHLGGQHVRVAPVPAVGEDHDLGPTGHAGDPKAVVELP